MIFSTCPFSFCLFRTKGESFQAMLDLLMSILEIKGPFATALQELKQVPAVQATISSSTTTGRLLSNRLFELDQLMEVLNKYSFSVGYNMTISSETRCSVNLDLSYVPTSKVFQGIVFEAVSSTVPQHTIAAGGCYEHLIDMFRLPQVILFFLYLTQTR